MTYSTTHVLRRTSAPGEPWLGKCTLCGQVGLAQYQAGEWCPGKSEDIQGNGTLDKVMGEEGKGRRVYRDRGSYRWPEIDGGDRTLLGPRSGASAQDAIGVPKKDQWVIREPAKAKHRQVGWFEALLRALMFWKKK